MYLGNGERMGSEVKEVIVQADGWHSQCFLPNSGDNALDFVEGFTARLDHCGAGGQARRWQTEQGFAIDLPVLGEGQLRQINESSTGTM